MSYLSNQLAVVLERLAITQSALCSQADISQPQLSRYLTGENSPSLETIEKICTVLPESDRSEVARAWLYDQMPPSARDLLTIHAHDPSGQVALIREERQTTVPSFAMPGKLREAFDFLERAAVDNPDVRASILAAYRILSPSD